MAARPTGLSSPALRHLQLALLSASDDQLVRIIALLDKVNKLDKSGDADALIAPIRSRLAQLRPDRPLAFTRLLFLPADPLVVAAPGWVRGQLGLPRTALLPLGTQVRAGLGDLATKVEAMIRGGRFGDTALVERAGALLWPAAATVLDRAGVPAGWTEATGLGAADHAVIARCAACVLSEAVWVHAAMRASAEGLGPDPDEMRSWLEGAVSRRPEPAGALLAVLVLRLPGATALIGPPPSHPGRSVAYAEPAIDFLLEHLEASPHPFAELTETATDVQRAVALLDGLDTPGPAQRPSRKPRTERLRHLLDERCLTRFSEDLARQLLAPLTDAIAQGELETLEEAARGLRRLETVGRRLGSGEHYDHMLAAAAREIGEEGAGSLVERARLVEILAGPEAALALLQG